MDAIVSVLQSLEVTFSETTVEHVGTLFRGISMLFFRQRCEHIHMALAIATYMFLHLHCYSFSQDSKQDSINNRTAFEP
jgi:hypothetical protein